jgi:hypothetical protein
MRAYRDQGVERESTMPSSQIWEKRMSIVITISQPITLPHTQSGEISLAPGEYTARPLPNTDTSGFWGLYDVQGNFRGNIAIQISQDTSKLG